MFELLKKLRSAKKQTVADLRAALAEIDLAALASAVDAANKKRVALLIDATTDAQVLEAEAGIDAARIAHDRGKVIKAELERRLALAEKDEAAAALAAKRDRVEKRAAAAAADIKRRWLAAQTVLLELLENLDRAEAEVREVNEELGAAGRGNERVADVEWRARPRPEVEWEGAVSLAVTTLLPELPEWGLAGYGRIQGAGSGSAPPEAPADNRRTEQSHPKPWVQPPARIVWPRT